MTRSAKKALQAVPLFQHESLFPGSDIGKTRHVAGFVSKTLLERHQRFEACPALAFANSREGFAALVERMRELAPLEHYTVLLEKTGHYHKALQQFLQELDLPVYMIPVQERPSAMMKTDKRDALGLANTLYTQYELVREATQRKNKLTAICDEIFPELTQVLKNPTRPTALAIRERFPTPHALATASLSARKSVRGKTRMLSDTKLLDLQRLAASSIGTKDMQRKPGLLIEQTQLIRELHLLQEHMVQLETEITSILEQSREGQIVQSFGIGPIQTATILAAIGSIENFPNAGSLKSYCGWSPTEKQSGLTLNSTRQTRGGTRMMKQMMYLIVTGLISRDTEWAKRDVRLVQAKCPVDPRTGERSGNVRIIGRVAGQLIETMYAPMVMSLAACAERETETLLSEAGHST